MKHIIEFGADTDTDDSINYAEALDEIKKKLPPNLVIALENVAREGAVRAFKGKLAKAHDFGEFDINKATAQQIGEFFGGRLTETEKKAQEKLEAAGKGGKDHIAKTEEQLKAKYEADLASERKKIETSAKASVVKEQLKARMIGGGLLESAHKLADALIDAHFAIEIDDDGPQFVKPDGKPFYTATGAATVDDVLAHIKKAESGLFANPKNGAGSQQGSGKVGKVDYSKATPAEIGAAFDAAFQ